MSNHVIKRMVLELHTSSEADALGLEDDVRDIVAGILKTQLEAYCNSIDQQSAIVYVEKLELDLGKIELSKFHEVAKARIMASLPKKGAPVRYPVFTKEKERSAKDEVMYFLKTGTLSWKSSYVKDDDLLSSRMQQLLRSKPDIVGEIIHTVLKSEQLFDRFLFHISDEVLFQVVASPVISLPDKSLVHNLKDLWDRCAVFSSSKSRRLFFWKTVFHVFFRTPRKTREDILGCFLTQWALTQYTPIASLLNSIRLSVENVKGDQRDGFHRMLIDLLSSKDKERLSHQAWETGIAAMARTIESGNSPDIKNVIQLQVKLIKAASHVIPFFSDKQAKDFRNALKIFIDDFFKEFLSDPLFDDIPDNSDSWVKSFESEWRHIEALLHEMYPDYGKAGNNQVLQMIITWRSEMDNVRSADQLISFVTKFEDVIRALPGVHDMSRIISHVHHLKEKLSGIKADYDDHRLMHALHQLEKRIGNLDKHANVHELQNLIHQLSSIIRLVPSNIVSEERLVPYQNFISLLTALPSELSRADKQEMLLCLEKVIGKKMESHSEELIDLYHEDTEDDVYVHNAGLVLIAPFLKALFEQAGYMTENEFKSNETIDKAIMLLQYLVAPGGEFREYDMAFNKLLCGKDVTYPVDLTLTLSESEKAEAEDMLSAILEQTDVFKNISKEGFRNAFLQREGVLSPNINHLVLKVSKETFDIVLDKLPWQFHVIRLPWMSFPIMIEW